MLLKTPNLLIYFTILILMFITTVKSQNLSIVLNKKIGYFNNDLYSGFIYLNHSSTIQVELVNVNKDVNFVILQVHSHFYNVTMFSTTPTKNSQITGRNLGMYSLTEPNIDTFYITNENKNDLRLYVAVQGYRDTDPIPGGCNMEFSLYVSPFMFATYNEHFVNVDAAPAQYFNDTRCVTSVNRVKVSFYRLYLSENDFDEDTYFGGIQKMTSISNILKYGHLIPMTSPMWRMRRIVSAYPGTGSIFVAIAFDETKGYSVYVPTHTYACPAENGCELLNDYLSMFLCAVLAYFGVFICYCGHRYFKMSMFTYGLMTGFIITYIVIVLIADMDSQGRIAVSLLSGLCFGAIWYLFWWYYAIPVYSILLVTLNLGFFVAALTYFGITDISFLTLDINFWLFVVFIMVLTAVTLISITYTSYLLACAVLGGYAAIYPIDYYVGTNLKYIVINLIRRATVPKFKYAVVSPPFQWADALIASLWVALAITGFFLQHYQNRGRPPFPPPPRSVSEILPEFYEPTDRNRRYGTVTGAIPSAPPPSIPVSAGAYSEITPLLA